MKHAGKLLVSLELLEQWLDLPEGLKLKAVYPPGPHLGVDETTAAFYVVDETGNWLPVQDPGAEAWPVMAIYVSEHDGPRLHQLNVGGQMVDVPAEAPRQHPAVMLRHL